MATGELQIEIGMTAAAEEMMEQAWANAGLKSRWKLTLRRKGMTILLCLGCFLGGFACGGIFVVRLLQQG